MKAERSRSSIGGTRPSPFSSPAPGVPLGWWKGKARTSQGHRHPTAKRIVSNSLARHIWAVPQLLWEDHFYLSLLHILAGSYLTKQGISLATNRAGVHSKNLTERTERPGWMGLGATRASGRCPCPRNGWNKIIFKDSSNPDQPGIPWDTNSISQVCRTRPGSWDLGTENSSGGVRPPKENVV